MDNYKSQICKFWLESKCFKGGTCTYRHGIFDSVINPFVDSPNKCFKDSGIANIGIVGCGGAHSYENCPNHICVNCGEEGHTRSICTNSRVILKPLGDHNFDDISDWPVLK